MKKLFTKEFGMIMQLLQIALNPDRGFDYLMNF